MPGPYHWTYFVKDIDNGLVKIGRCADVQQRMRTMERDNAHPLTLLGVHQGDHEKETHLVFAHLRHRREWFRCTPELLAFIESRRVDVPSYRADKAECCGICRKRAVIGTGFCRRCAPRPVEVTS
jgi:hypothetical protein